MVKMRNWLFAGIACAAIITTSCKKDDNNNTQSYPIQMKLTDAPGDYEAVYIDIQGVEVHAENTNSNSGWQTLNVKKGIYDLVKLTNGADTVFAMDTLPIGKISQIRLILGDKNSVKLKDGTTHDIKTPSAQQSGLKLNVHETLTAGITYTILLDFDASKSIVEKGNGDYSLKPVIRTIAQATSGAIKGIVNPANLKPAVYAVMGTDSFGTYADSTGYYMIQGLQAGSYNVVFVPAAPTASKTVNGVNVTIGQVTDMGTVNVP